jgi:arabinose-5-phosphate isomerase
MLKMKENATDQELLQSARAVLAREIEGLQAVADTLDGGFIQTINIIAGLKGRLIISGMGKSGHIARKMAATFSSTGTPAHFVHPSEASHGDLGMITADDGVLLLSNSGETAELHDIITYTRRFSIPLMALVRRKSSMLVDSADIAIVLPEVPEASPIGAPTTSTIMMLAYGDALAMALLERRGFTKEDFGVYHPGGKLGQAFIRVESLMHGPDELPLVSLDHTMDSVLIEMTAKRFGCVGVVKDHVLQGIITDGDLRRHMRGDILAKKASEVMTANPVTANPRMLAAEALGIMNRKAITCLFVLDEHKKPVGILHIHDCLRAGVV